MNAAHRPRGATRCRPANLAPSLSSWLKGLLGLGTARAMAVIAFLASLTLAAVPTFAQPVNAPGWPAIQCISSVTYDASTNGATELVPLATGKTIYVCGYTIVGGGTATVALKRGTGTACATSGANITPAFSLVAQTVVSDASPYFRGLATPVSNALCLITSAGVPIQAVVYYGQY